MGQKGNERTMSATKTAETYPTGNGKVIEGSVKTTEELELEVAHAELLATARLCEAIAKPKRVVVKPCVYKDGQPKTKENLVSEAVYGYEERHITKHNLEAVGGAAITALAKYHNAYNAFELSQR